ncbi:MAG: response regulator [Candidatus Rokubacteria bacterium]|nr:response regulator [Candidatus Rokubacteria bacterium]
MSDKILVVDDEPVVAETVAEVLRAAGYEPETSTDSVAAVRQLAAAAYDLIVSDIMMPDLTGLQLLSLIKARSPSPEVILITGFSTRERAMEALERGAFAYIEKPFDSAELLERVKQALWKRWLAVEWDSHPEGS